MPHGNKFLLIVQLPALGVSGAQSEHCSGIKRQPMAIQIWRQQSMTQGMPLSCLQLGKRAAGTTSRMSPSVIRLGKALPPACVLCML